MSSTDLFDAITLEVERADSLALLLEQRLQELDERPDAPSELYALSLIAASVCQKLQLIRDKARALHESQAKTRKDQKTGGAR